MIQSFIKKIRPGNSSWCSIIISLLLLFHPEYSAADGQVINVRDLCRNVIFRDFTILYGGHFGILATGVDNFTTDNLKIDTNRDGIDVDCCRNVRISNCTVNSPWDDAICLKNSFALGFARATENVTITNCIFEYCRGLALETVDGGFLEDVTVTNLVMRDLSIVDCPQLKEVFVKKAKDGPVKQVKTKQ